MGGQGGKRPRILVVEDDTGVLRVYEQALADREWHVETATNVDDALKLSAAAGFDLYVVDKNLPGKSGVDFIRELRKNDDRGRCIMVTAFANTESAIETSNLGIDAYVKKPFSVVELIESVSELVEAGPAERSIRDQRVNQFFAHGGSAKAAKEPFDHCKRILIAGIDAEARKEIIRHLVHDRHDVDIVSSLETLAVSDYEFPVCVVFAYLDGGNAEAAERDTAWLVEARQAWPQGAIVAITTKLSVDDVRKLREAGVSAILDRQAAHFADNLDQISSLLLE